MSASTVHYEKTYIILFLTLHDVSIDDDKNDDLTHRPRVSLARLHTTHEVTIDC